MYKLLLSVLLAIGLTLANVPPEVEKAFKTCTAKLPKADAKVMDKFCEASYTKADNDTKCLLRCVGEETGLFTPDGRIIEGQFLNFAPPSVAKAKLDEVLAKYSVMIKADSCDTAFSQWKCMCELK